MSDHIFRDHDTLGKEVSMSQVIRYPILDSWVDNVDMHEALAKVIEFVEKGQRVHTVFASNPEKNFHIAKDKLLHSVFKTADLLLPDGIGMIHAMRLVFGERKRRVTGCDFMESICALAAAKKYKVFVYGAKEEVNLKAVETLQSKYPRLQIAGRSNGYVAEDDMGSLVQKINESGAEILFLALGSPKQEYWVAKHAHELKNVRVCQGIGGTLDVVAGNVKRAPEFFCKTGMEWLYRLISEPKRWKRQLVLPVFAARIVASKVCFWRHPGVDEIAPT